jgi:hypothetical protein
MEGDLRLAERLLDWARPPGEATPAEATPPIAGRGDHQTRQAATPLWRWQMAS